MEMMSAVKLQVLLISADPQSRSEFAAALRARGFEVSAVRHIAEIQRWPVGEIVVVDSRQFTPWWAVVGAAHVVVLSDTSDQTEKISSGVPSTWIRRESGPDALIAALRSLPPATGRPSCTDSLVRFGAGRI
jgi:hypothetical protein